MIKLNYTTEMKKQDDAWDSQNESKEAMEVLHSSIMEEAYSKGFKGIHVLDEIDGEIVTLLFDSYEDMEKAHEEEIEGDSYCRCISLIKDLEYRLNQ